MTDRNIHAHSYKNVALSDVLRDILTFHGISTRMKLKSVQSKESSAGGFFNINKAVILLMKRPVSRQVFRFKSQAFIWK